MSWFLIIFFLSSTFHNLSEAAHGKNLPSAVVVGTVYCDTCFQDAFSKTSHFISGASVAVECAEGSSNSKPSFQKEVKTDKHGEFKVQLPFSVSKHVKKIKECSVKLISSSEPYCAVASTATPSSLHLKSRKQGTHIFSAGFFTFKPLKQPDLCNQKPSIENSKGVNTMKSLLPPTLPIQDPTMPNLPPLPLIPNLPPLPLLPPLPGVPGLPPVPKNTMPSNSKSTESSKVYHPDFFLPIPLIPFLPPNPLQPPILPPIPLLPPPLLPNPLQPPPVLPNPLQPPPAPVIPLPPIPGLTPSPPPQSPTIPLPFPPLPLPPAPHIPGIPPASSSPVKTSP